MNNFVLDFFSVSASERRIAKKKLIIYSLLTTISFFLFNESVVQYLNEVGISN